MTQCPHLSKSARLYVCLAPASFQFKPILLLSRSKWSNEKAVMKAIKHYLQIKSNPEKIFKAKSGLIQHYLLISKRKTEKRYYGSAIQAGER